MTNIIFLDIASIIEQTTKDNVVFSDKCIANLQYILSKIENTKFVLCNMQQMNFSTIDFCKKINMPKDIVASFIQCSSNEDKVACIINWIDKNKQKIGLGTYVLIDSGCKQESKLNKAFPNNVVFCKDDYDEKLTINKAKEAIWILSGFSRSKDEVKHWLISDTHFFHSNIIKYCNRPFKDVEEMNAQLVQRWNAVVGKQDIVHHLGDFCFGKKENVISIFQQLNGKIDLVLGNHDCHKVNFYYDVGFHRVYDKPIVLRNFFILSHAPLEWVANDGPYCNIYGHVHDSERYRTTARSCCVCVERQNYSPILWDDAITAMKKEEQWHV